MKSVLITGCSSGFGRGMVDEFLQRGWHVFCTMRDAQQRKDILAEPLKNYGQHITLLSLDLTEPEQRDAVFKEVSQYGRLDCLVNNAGQSLFGALEDLGEEQFLYHMEVNFLAPALLTRSFLPLLRESQGSVIFISSIFGFAGFPLTSAYCASKYALEGFAESLYYELEPHNVRVAVVEPGASRTNFGKNVTWGSGTTKVYRQQTENYHNFKARLSQRAQFNTPLVARRVADIAEKESQSLLSPRSHLRCGSARSRVGRDATLFYWFERLLPKQLSTAILKQLYRRIFY
ncbi:SDR family oxidoreductase [Lusitaniella coriacea LEGE 07157]|uniref:SDR family oxidoreductase n=1 Tax=Lusitaniella coriacea LEGE 07157 TaxID=945747 RepID=A0A8J7DVJ1_9CYAN|nr:SDR family oxidoreductase [Lusitaniella coriacea]MBE9115571.1 SDR family oxidoreductase [Lusitaniella coriacea LEGE 07157]